MAGAVGICSSGTNGSEAATICVAADAGGRTTRDCVGAVNGAAAAKHDGAPPQPQPLTVPWGAEWARVNEWRQAQQRAACPPPDPSPFAAARPIPLCTADPTGDAAGAAPRASHGRPPRAPALSPLPASPSRAGNTPRPTRASARRAARRAAWYRSRRAPPRWWAQLCKSLAVAMSGGSGGGCEGDDDYQLCLRMVDEEDVGWEDGAVCEDGGAAARGSGSGGMSGTRHRGCDGRRGSGKGGGSGGSVPQLSLWRLACAPIRFVLALTMPLVTNRFVCRCSGLEQSVGTCAAGLHCLCWAIPADLDRVCGAAAAALHCLAMPSPGAWIVLRCCGCGIESSQRRPTKYVPQAGPFVGVLLPPGKSFPTPRNPHALCPHLNPPTPWCGLWGCGGQTLQNLRHPTTPTCPMPHTPHPLCAHACGGRPGAGVLLPRWRAAALPLALPLSLAMFLGEVNPLTADWARSRGLQAAAALLITAAAAVVALCPPGGVVVTGRPLTAATALTFVGRCVADSTCRCALFWRLGWDG
eukprot:365214-Chlamydomonas_euryale.AAC.1